MSPPKTKKVPKQPAMPFNDALKKVWAAKPNPHIAKPAKKKKPG